MAHVGVNGANWPNAAAQAVCTAVFIAIICLLASLSAIRAHELRLKLRTRTWAQYTALATVLSALLYVAGGTLLVYGVGPSKSQKHCSNTQLVCIWLYALAKASAYAFLLERLYLVHSDGLGTPRRYCKPWLVGVGGVSMLMAMAIVFTTGRIARLNEDGHCHLGVQAYAGWYTLVSDIVINAYVTAAFVWPLCRRRFQQARRLAIESCVAAVVTAVCFSANILIFMGFQRESGWQCLLACSIDTAIGATCIWLITSHRHGDDLPPQRRKSASTDGSTTKSIEAGRRSVSPTV